MNSLKREPQEKQPCGLTHEISLGGFMLKMLRTFQSRSRDGVQLRDVLSMGMTYVNRVKQAVPASYYCNHCLFLTALILTQKVSYDNLAMSNADFSKHAKVPLKHINRYESWVLRVLEYKLNIDLTDATKRQTDEFSSEFLIELNPIPLETISLESTPRAATTTVRSHSNLQTRTNPTPHSSTTHAPARRSYSNLHLSDRPQHSHYAQTTTTVSAPPYLHIIDNFLALATEQQTGEQATHVPHTSTSLLPCGSVGISPNSTGGFGSSCGSVSNDEHETDAEESEGPGAFMFGVACQYSVDVLSQSAVRDTDKSVGTMQSYSSSLCATSSTDSLEGSSAFGNVQREGGCGASLAPVGSSSGEFVMGAMYRTPNRYNPYVAGSNRMQRISVYN